MKTEFNCVAAAPGLVLIACAGATAQIYNGPFSTGSLTASGVPAPAGTVWSELQTDGGSCANAITGYSATDLGPTTGFRIADDFTHSAVDGNVKKICVYIYVTDPPPEPPVITGGSLRIWNGRPGDITSSVIFGDTTTNRLLSQTFYNMYRIPSTTTPPPGTPPNTSRPVYKVDLDVSPTGLALPPGTYWLDWSISVPAGSSAQCVSLTPVGVRSQAGYNARQLNVATSAWSDLFDPGNPGSCSDVPVDIAWYIVHIQPIPPCPPNCDGSTTAPYLTANDFQCFLNAFANGASYANCDGSTTPPVLTANDFQCFLNLFAAGCSAP